LSQLRKSELRKSKSHNRAAGKSVPEHDMIFTIESRKQICPLTWEGRREKYFQSFKD
jgi:hypothetical protein